MIIRGSMVKLSQFLLCRDKDSQGNVYDFISEAGMNESDAGKVYQSEIPSFTLVKSLTETSGQRLWLSVTKVPNRNCENDIFHWF